MNLLGSGRPLIAMGERSGLRRHRDDGNRFIVRARSEVDCVLGELESTIHKIVIDIVCRRGQSRLPLSPLGLPLPELHLTLFPQGNRERRLVLTAKQLPTRQKEKNLYENSMHFSNRLPQSTRLNRLCSLRGWPRFGLRSHEQRDRGGQRRGRAESIGTGAGPW